MKKVVCAVILFFVIVPCFAEKIIISQIDNSSLLVNQNVQVYFSFIDDQGYPVENLNKDKLRVFENGVNRNIVEFKSKINVNQGIKLFIVLDNSGSMYDDASGNATEDVQAQRMTYAKKAILSLLSQIKNPHDKTGFMSFNTSIGTIEELSSDNVRVELSLENVKRPLTPEQSYTELNEAVYFSVNRVSEQSGRKVIILLSDGENYPKKDNEEFKQRHELSNSLELARKYGVSIYTIGLGLGADNRYLASISEKSGGSHFQIDNPEELDQLYSFIRNRVLNEYYLSYPATMSSEDQKMVRIEIAGSTPVVQDEGSYFSAMVFGKPTQEFSFLLFGAIVFALLLLAFLFFVRLKKAVKAPTVQTLSSAWSKGKAEPMTIVNDGQDMIIGNDAGADLTIQDDNEVSMNAAKISKKGDVFTLVAEDSSVLINNQEVKSKVLRSGDIITIGNTQLVFDKGMTKMMGSKTKSKRPKK
ncbi:MAG: VWA domain-containing protein [Spirochaetales bacterium]|nr:VWA domain-containing protein [Spirochaetales bacterium]